MLLSRRVNLQAGILRVFGSRSQQLQELRTLVSAGVGAVLRDSANGSWGRPRGERTPWRPLRRWHLPRGRATQVRHSARLQNNRPGTRPVHRLTCYSSRVTAAQQDDAKPTAMLDAMQDSSALERGISNLDKLMAHLRQKVEDRERQVGWCAVRSVWIRACVRAHTHARAFTRVFRVLTIHRAADRGRQRGARVGREGDRALAPQA